MLVEDATVAMVDFVGADAEIVAEEADVVVDDEDAVVGVGCAIGVVVEDDQDECEC